VSPRALAVFRLMISSIFVGCSMGKSAGLAPWRILCTKFAACRKRSGKLGPYAIRPPCSTSSLDALDGRKSVLRDEAYDGSPVENGGERIVREDESAVFLAGDSRENGLEVRKLP
jgi:hypothetical protein